jgi:hypothetical protein
MEETYDNWVKERQQKLIESGRYLPPEVVAIRLARGEGTVIVVHESPKGPTFEWWVDRDLIQMAPAEFDPWSRLGRRSTLQREAELLKEFARNCLEQHTNEESGDAMLIDSILSEDQTIAERFPNAKVVSIRAWGGMTITLGYRWEKQTN